jgi:hypothetical protein
MTDIRKKLDALRERVDEGAYGAVYGAKESADERLKIIKAQQRVFAPKGSVADTDAWVMRRPEVIQAIEDKCNAFADWKTAETYMKLSFIEFDIWRSEEATNRGLDKRSTG